LEKGRRRRSLPLFKGELEGVHLGITLVSILVATFLLASVQLLPTLELSALSSRATPGGFDIVRANQHSYPLYHLPTFLLPKFYGTDNTYWGKRLEIEYGTYIGVIPLLLSIWYLARRRRAPFSPTFFVYLLIISFLLSLGDMSPFRFIGIEPSLWFFSAPARWLLFTTFSLSLFAGFGFDALWENVNKTKKFFSRVAFVIIGVVILGNILFAVVSPLPNWGEGWFSKISHKNQNKLHSLVVSAKTSSISLKSPYTYMAILSLLILPYTLTHKNSKKFIIAVTVIDLVIISGTTTPLFSWKNVLQQPTTLQNMPEQVKNNQARIYSLRDGGDTGAYFTDPSSRADNAKRQLQKDLLVPMVSSQFGIYGIEWPASLDLSEQGAVLERLHPTKPYAVEDTELASELTIGAVLSPTENGEVNIEPLESKSRFELLCDDAPTPGSSPSGRGRESDSSPFQGEAGWGAQENCNNTLTLISEQPSELIFKTASKTDSTLIVRDTFYPGWRAYVDNKETEIQKSPLFFRSIPVPAGEHVVTMKYAPKMLYIGGIVSLLTLITLTVIPGLTRNPRVRQ
ncbi:MAG: YfhO family protein, partial [bacterium]|nr:YfhO family protein [bacterium]